MNITDVEKQLFFIIGCSRSGTTLTQLMISSHPDVALPDETGFYTMLYGKYSKELGELKSEHDFNLALEKVLDFYRIKDLGLNADLIKLKCQAGNLSWETIFLAILATLAETNGVSRVGEKTPHHLYYIELLKQRFPNAKFIHIIRDPRAVYASFKKAQHKSNDVRVLCGKWKYAVEIHSKYSLSLGHKKYLLIKYEDLVFNTRNTLNTICNFLEIEYKEEMLNYYQRNYLGFNKRYLSHMSNTLKPIFKSSIDKWKYELNSWEIAIIQKNLCKEMNFMGYNLIKNNAVFPYLKYAIYLFKNSPNGLIYYIKKATKFILE